MKAGVTKSCSGRDGVRVLYEIGVEEEGVSFRLAEFSGRECSFVGLSRLDHTLAVGPENKEAFFFLFLPALCCEQRAGVPFPLAIAE